MRKYLLLLLLLGAGLALPGATRAGHPCWYSGGGCQHWPDGFRANKTQVSVYRSNTQWPGGAWNTDLQTAVNRWNAAQSKINKTVYSAGTTCTGDPSVTTVSFCANDNTSVYCGGVAPNYWVACTGVWSWYEWNGSGYVLKNHLWGVYIRVDTFTNNMDGSVFPWTGYTRRVSFCHELGHALGGDHITQRGAGQPDNSSCLHNPMEIYPLGESGLTSEYPGTHVGGDVDAKHSHSDTTWAPGSYFGDLSVQQRAVTTARLLRLTKKAKKLAAPGHPLNGKKIVFLREWDDPKSLPAPEGVFKDYVYVTRLPETTFGDTTVIVPKPEPRGGFAGERGDSAVVVTP